MTKAAHANPLCTCETCTCKPICICGLDVDNPVSVEGAWDDGRKEMTYVVKLRAKA